MTKGKRAAALLREICDPLLRSNPLTLLAAAWGLGLWFGWLAGESRILPTAGIVLCLGASLFLFLRLHKGKALMIVLAAIAAGYAWMCFAVPGWLLTEETLMGSWADVRGEVVSLVYPGSESVLLDHVVLTNEAGESISMKGKLRLWVSDAEGEGLAKGAVISSPMTLTVPAISSVPGDSSRRVTAAVKGIRMNASAGYNNITIETEAPEPGWIDSLRLKIARTLESDFPGEGCALLRALLLADTGGMSDSQRETYQKLGISHLLAVSGLHIELILMLAAVFPNLFAALFGKKGYTPGYNTFALLSGLFLAFFVMMTGWTASIGRAVIMHLFLYIGRYTRRPVTSRQAWACAFCVITLIDPMQILSAGFQLSMAASGALLWYPLTEKPAWAAPIKTTCLVTAATLPWTLYHYGQISPLSPLSNLLLVPLAEGILMLGLLYEVGALCCPVLCGGLYPLLRALLDAMAHLSGWMETLAPSVSMVLHAGGFAVIAVLGLLLLSPYLLELPNPIRAGCALVTAGLMACALWIPGWESRFTQGSLLCWGNASGTAVMIATDEDPILAGNTPIDPGDLLLSADISRLGALVYTGDSWEDASEWLRDIRETTRVDTLYVSEELADGEEEASFARREGINVILMADGDEILGDDFCVAFEMWEGKKSSVGLRIITNAGEWVYGLPSAATGSGAVREGTEGMIASSWKASERKYADETGAEVYVCASGGCVTDEAVYDMIATGCVLLKEGNDGAVVLTLGGR